MPRHDFQISPVFKHHVVFTRNAFAPENPELPRILHEGGGRRALVLLEQSVAAAWPGLDAEITRCFAGTDVKLAAIHVMPGGESAKNDDTAVRAVWSLIHTSRIDRHSYVIAIGGGAFLDVAGFAAATAHRGVRLLRFPTTTLSQSDSGVGVKSAINAFGRKNWIGAFAVPFAVINDFRFLQSQDPETRRSGLIESIKVALVKDRAFFEWIESNLDALATLDPAAIEACVERSALLHLHHIALGGDPFESGSGRPLDFGHWSAHKLEAMTSCDVPHDRAVSAGVALDTLYSARSGRMPDPFARQVLAVLEGLGLMVWHPAMDWRDENGRRRILDGLDEFREHLGGRLTLMMLQEPGVGTEVHQIDETLLGECLDELRGLGLTQCG
jgi:3-dehydroquinate synthase